MGCGSSKERPLSARSWMAADGWIPSHNFDEIPKEKTRNGKVYHEETAVEKKKTGEESMFSVDESRHIGDCAVGLTVRIFLHFHLKHDQ